MFILILIVYLFIVSRGLFIAATAQDTFSRLLAGSISLTFFYYVFVNTVDGDRTCYRSSACRCR